MLDDQRKCKICKKIIPIVIGGFGNYARQGICESCSTAKKTKACTKCKEEKPIDQFWSAAGGAKRVTRCHTCMLETKRALRKKRPKKETRKVEKTDKDLFNQLNKRW